MGASGESSFAGPDGSAATVSPELEFSRHGTTVPSDAEHQFLRRHPYPYCISRKVSRKAAAAAVQNTKTGSKEHSEPVGDDGARSGRAQSATGQLVPEVLALAVERRGAAGDRPPGLLST